ncbi:MAG: TonB family protein [Pseudomonadota bacterium]
MGSIIRSVFGIPLAGVIVIALFLLMYGLIRVDGIIEVDQKDPPNISIGRQIDDTDVTNQRRFDRPKIDEPPPPPPAINQADFTPSVDGVEAAVPTFDRSVNIQGTFNPDREAQPLVRIPPEYPQRCASRHRESESVRLRFNVTPEGEVTDVQVVDSTQSCFNRSAIRSAQRWKYQPKIVEGKPAPRIGVETVIRFEPPVE